MDDKFNQIVSALQELRESCIKADEDNITEIIHKYDMLFVGSKFNTIYSIELAHALKNYFKIEIEHSELIQIIPTLCSTVNMKYEEMVAMSNVSKNTTDAYKIELF